MLLYLAQEGRGIGLLNKLRAYELQEQGRDTVEANLELGFKADAREYGIGSQILADLGLTTIRVLTNNPRKISGISGFGLTVVSQEPIEIEPNDENRGYLETKRDKLGHTLGGRLHHQDERYDVRRPEEDGIRWTTPTAGTTSARRRGRRRPTSSSARARTCSRAGRATPSEIRRRPTRSLRRADDASRSSRDARDRAGRRARRDADEPSGPGRRRRAATGRGEPEHAPGALVVPPGYPVLEGEPSGRRRAVGIVVSRFNGDITGRLLDSALDELAARGVEQRLDHRDARAGRLRAAARGDGAREDAAVRLHRRARLRDPRRHAALRLRRGRGRLGAPARRDRDGRPGRVRRAHARAASTRPRRASRRAPRRSGPRSRWPTCSRTWSGGRGQRAG